MAVDKKISQLPAASQVLGADLGLLVHAGSNLKFDFDLLVNLVTSSISVGASFTFGTVVPQNTDGNDGDVFFKTDTIAFYQKSSGVWAVVFTFNPAGDGTMLYGTSVPNSGIGKDADSYINTVTGIFYLKTAGTWAQVFSMATGPQGPQGTAGTDGVDGTNGNTVLSGASNPSNLFGVDGDYYINYSTYAIFGPKAASVWGTGLSMIGPIGPGVPDGGTAGQVLAKIDSTDQNTQWVTPGSVWGSITGTLSDQTDLQAALDAKSPVLSFSNGLTNLSNNVTLGGSLSSNAYIDTQGNNGQFRYLASGNNIYAGIEGSNAELLGYNNISGASNKIIVNSTNLQIYNISSIATSARVQTFTFAPGASPVWQSGVLNLPINYGGDYSANYTSRSFIDKGYADARYALITSAGVTSIFGRSGTVTAQSGDYNTSQVTENTNLYYTDARVRSSTLTGLSISGGTISSTDSTLVAFGKLQNQITGLAGGVTYQGTWDASTNTPTLTSGTGTKGFLYKVSVAGSTTLDGISQWNVGDQVVFNGTTWDKIDGIASEVISFNTRVGAITLISSDVTVALGYTPYNSTNPSNYIGLSALSATSPIFYSSSTGVISSQASSSSQAGYLTSSDWSVFNNKQAALTFDTTPTASSTNPVTSGGIYTYVTTSIGADGIVSGLVTTTVTTTATTTAGTYRLNNALIIKSGSTNTTIPAQDATLNRYTLIVGDGSGVLSAVNGTLATDAVEPDIPINKALIASIYIPATGGTVTTTGGGSGKGTVTKVTSSNTDILVANQTTTPILTLNRSVLFASPALTGNPTAPTQTTADNSTKIATTAYVKNEIDSNAFYFAGFSGDGTTIPTAFTLITDSTPTSSSINPITSGGVYTAITGKQILSFTTTGTSGAATFNTSTGALNIPNYASGSGTVTNVASGSGLTGGPITTTGTLSVDQAFAFAFTNKHTYAFSDSSSSGSTNYGIAIATALSQTSTAGWTDININRTGTPGSGSQFYVNFSLAGVSKFSVNSLGFLTSAAGVNLSGSITNGIYAQNATSFDGYFSQNFAPATSGIPNIISPRYNLQTNVWNTTTSHSDVVNFIQEVLPVSSATPGYKYNWSGRVNSSGTGAFTQLMSLDNSGVLTLPLLSSGMLKSVSGVISAAVAGTDYQAVITLTTTGTSGAATFSAGVLNIPQYAGTTYSAGTGLTLTGSVFSVNSSQSISQLSNLTTNGVVTTTSGNGTLSIVGVTGTGSVVLAASPALTGTPTAPTQTASDNSTKIATTAYADAAVQTGIATIQISYNFFQSTL